MKLYNWGKPKRALAPQLSLIQENRCTYVCMYVCSRYVVHVFIMHNVHAHIELSKDRQHRLHVNSNCSSPKQELASARTEQQHEQPANYSRERLREQPIER